MPQPRIDVIILNWNRSEDTVRCLGSLEHQTYDAWRAIVVDNGSTDGSVATIRARFPDLRVIANPRNLGFAAGCNIGISAALREGADYVFLLNNDTVVDKECLSTLAEVARESGYGILAPAIHYYNRPDALWSAGARRGRFFPVALDETQLQDGLVPVDFVTGCAMLVARATFETVGLLDESYFMYYEDSDLCRRASLAGVRVGVVPRAEVWHKVAVSFQTERPRERRLRIVGGVRFYLSDLQGPSRLLLGPWLCKRLATALWMDAGLVAQTLMRPLRRGASPVLAGRDEHPRPGHTLASVRALGQLAARRHDHGGRAGENKA